MSLTDRNKREIHKRGLTKVRPDCGGPRMRKGS